MLGLPPPLRVEEISANAWPDLQTTLYDGWLLRYAAGVSKRSNSVWPHYSSTIELRRKIDYCEDFFHNLGLPAIFKLTGFSVPSDLDGALEHRRYEIVDPTSLQVLDLSRVSAPARSSEAPGGESGPKVRVEYEFTRAWTNAFERCNGRPDEAHQAVTRELFSRIRPRVIACRAEEDGAAIGCGFAVVEKDAAGLYGICVQEDHRRRGIGSALTRTLLQEARSSGARFAYLQVVASNRPAVALYGTLGFREYYRYWYRREPVAV